MNNNDEIREIKDGIGTFVGTLERLKAALGKEMDAYSLLRTKAPSMLFTRSKCVLSKTLPRYWNWTWPWMIC